MKNMDKGLTLPKLEADKSAENTLNVLKFICPLSTQAQTFGILMKKGFIGRPYSVIQGIVIMIEL